LLNGGSKNMNLRGFTEGDIVVGINEFGAEPIVNIRENNFALG
jgi:hypothetical protein